MLSDKNTVTTTQNPAQSTIDALAPARHTTRTIRLGLDVPAGFDLRRVRQRDTAETLLRRCEHLLPAEAALIKSVYADKRTIRELAQLQGRCERSTRREIRRLARRMLRPEFAIVVLHRASWPAQRQRVGEAMFLHGQGLRTTALLLGVTVYCVRTHAHAIKAIADEQRRARSRPHSADALVGGAL
jgi:hypothetical protein